jgi:hypothetical protein
MITVNAGLVETGWKERTVPHERTAEGQTALFSEESAEKYRNINYENECHSERSEESPYNRDYDKQGDSSLASPIARQAVQNDNRVIRCRSATINDSDGSPL